MRKGLDALENFYSRRSRLYILSKILSLSIKETKKTHIMYGANMSYNQLRTYLDFLISAGLLKIVKNGDETLYKTTVKGRLFLKDFERIQSILKTSNSRA